MRDPTQRFSGRAETYLKYRPGYPPELIDILAQTCGLTPTSVVADIGSGTGMLTSLFLARGNPVFGVEPNQEMRAAGERRLQSYPNFTSVAARAEATTLPDHTIDLITAAQAFHWFDKAAARQEFARILKPSGWIALIWNNVDTTSSPFLRAYEALFHTFGTDYNSLQAEWLDAEKKTVAFFGPEGCQQQRLRHNQTFDLEGLKGRLLSTSYAPQPGHPNHEPMLQTLEDIFHRFEESGLVRFEYETKIYIGQLA